ncbi:methyl-accepting chemotaxis protein [Methanocaldococcus infernus]|uniref:Uncharacterized protein n=1 Tax=Methanocaldococcus infernus (strain DSM 11812 / JCM 15783 / ME) TaxID=573063 RepID=D5VSY3_METIM|nr:methyl-accepting chemotaxis protein [Methanocaldococcus infernus]ADG13686.1 conserved hypothetical protein [Methanocaldococcus infernus ME]
MVERDVIKELEDSINKLLVSIRNFKESNKNLTTLLNQLSDILNNVEKTIDITEKKLQEMVKRLHEGGSIKTEVLEKFIKNLENLNIVLDNVRAISNNIFNEMKKHRESLDNINDIVKKLENIEMENAKQALEEYYEVKKIMDENGAKLKLIVDKNIAIEERLKELLLEIDFTLENLKK